MELISFSIRVDFVVLSSLSENDWGPEYTKYWKYCLPVTLKLWYTRYFRGGVTNYKKESSDSV